MRLNSTSSQIINSSILAVLVGFMGSVPTEAAIAQQILQDDATAHIPWHLAQASSIQGNWVLRNMTEPPFPTPMVPSGELTADFSNGRLAGTGGCNQFKGSYKITGNGITVSPLASTFKACEEAVMTQEGRYLKALQAATRFQVSGDSLEIFYKTDEGEGVLRFSSKSVRGLW